MLHMLIVAQFLLFFIRVVVDARRYSINCVTHNSKAANTIAYPCVAPYLDKIYNL